MIYTLLMILSHKKTSPISIVFTMVAQKLEHRVSICVSWQWDWSVDPRSETDSRTWKKAPRNWNGAWHIKKSNGHLQQDIEIKYQFINGYHSKFTMKKMCQMLKIPMGGFYHWLNKKRILFKFYGTI